MSLSTLYRSYQDGYSFMGRGNQCIQLVKVLFCKLSTIGKKLPSFPHMGSALNHRPQRWEASVLPLPRPPSELIMQDNREIANNISLKM